MGMTRTTSGGGRRGWLAAVLVAAIRAYQHLAPQGLRRCCRYTPTCSEFAIGAFTTWGCLRGMVLVLHRVSRCRPPYGGTDPLPETDTTRRAYLSGGNNYREKGDAHPEC